MGYLSVDIDHHPRALIDLNVLRGGDANEMQIVLRRACKRFLETLLYRTPAGFSLPFSDDLGDFCLDLDGFQAMKHVETRSFKTMKWQEVKGSKRGGRIWGQKFE